MGKRTITLLSLFLVAGGPYASFAQEGEQASRSTPYRIGIFPGGGDFGGGGFGAEEKRVVRLVQTNIKENRALALAYSYYDDVLNEPRISKPDRLWAGDATQKKPNLELIFALAQERDIDGVVMYWGVRGGTAYITGTPNSVWLYLIDIERRRVHRAEAATKESSVRRLTEWLFANFMKGRPQVVLAKAIQPVAAKRQEVVSTTKTATVSPAEVDQPVAAKRQEVVSTMKIAKVSSSETFYQQGYRYSIGKGVPKDDAKAVLWYRRAAQEGHAGAQYNLGAAYANGSGVGADKETAVGWFFKAGQTFLKEGGKAKARQAVAAIKQVAPGHALGQQLQADIQAQSQ